MLRNYLKTTWRTLWRKKSYTAINLLGLALGMAACLVIAVYVRHELSYDDFHPSADRTVRLQRSTTEGGKPRPGGFPGPAAPSLVTERPDVEAATRLTPTPKILIRRGEESLYARGYRTDSSFFDLFFFETIAGSPARALEDPKSIVLTRPVAEALFDTTGAVGKLVRPRLQMAMLRGKITPYRVGAVIEAPPSNTHLDFSFLVPPPQRPAFQQWTGPPVFSVYARLAPDTPLDSFESAVQSWMREHLPEKRARQFFVSAERLPDIYLHSPVDWTGFRSGQVWSLYLFGGVAVLLLLIACINYLNLATVQAVERAKEVGIRKATGASRGGIATQFLVEAVVLGVLAFGAALGIATMLLPLFDVAVAADLPAHPFGHPLFLGVVFLAILSVVLLAGSYPTLYVSRFAPAEVFRSDTGRLLSGGTLRKGLIVLQFAVSVALIAGTGVMVQQMRYVNDKPLGVEVDSTLTVWLRQQESKTKTGVLKERLQQLPAVQAVSLSNDLPFRFRGGKVTARPNQIPGLDSPVQMTVLEGDSSFSQALGLSLVAGRRPTLSKQVLLNEAAVSALGWTVQEAVGQSIPMRIGRKKTTKTVTGIVSDFHYQSLYTDIQPTLITYSDDLTNRVNPSFLTVTTSGTPPEQLLSDVRQLWSDLFPALTFDYFFLENVFASAHRDAQQRMRLLMVGAAFMLLIACMGVFGVMSFAVARRRPEIGIRKVLGATARQVVQLLLKDVAVLVAAAFAIGLPAAYLGARWWLQDFAYRIELGPGVFALAGSLVLALALLTVSVHAVRAARLDPATTIREE